MKKEGIIEAVRKTGLTDYDAATVVNCVIDTINKALVKGERVEIRGFGILTPVTRAEKKGRNIGTGCQVIIPEHRSIKFVVSEPLKRRLNGC